MCAVNRPPNDTPNDRAETAAQLIHERRHRAGSAQVCDDCRSLAEQIDRLYRPATVIRPLG
jgi:hypothetical protein